MTETNPDSVEAGSVHGRFQPFHNGHLEYLEAALLRCEYLFVGITQFRRKHLVQVDASGAVHRALPVSNPLTFFERFRVATAVMRSLDVPADRYSVIPFPVEEPEELTDFLPSSVTVFTTTYDKWNEQKIDVLRTAGYHVVNLWTRSQKAVEGQEVRRLIVADDPHWRELVPAAVAAVLEDLNLAERLRALTVGQDG
jgi:nicotinamide mononucleotide adenylyltransferase